MGDDPARLSARDNPSGMETLVATTARQLAVPSQYRQLRNPLSASSDSLHAGMEHFADHCATCHANDGSGDTSFGKGLYPLPPDMAKRETQNKSDGELYYTLENGIRLSGMPAFGEQHAKAGDMETWNLVLFIRHLPNQTVEELKQMEQLNPITDRERLEDDEGQNFLRGGTVSVETPDFPQLPWRMDGSVKEFHLIAEPVKQEIVPGRVIDDKLFRRANDTE